MIKIASITIVIAIIASAFILLTRKPELEMPDIYPTPTMAFVTISPPSDTHLTPQPVGLRVTPKVNPVEDKIKGERLCSYGGGTWMELPTTCVDNCGMGAMDCGEAYTYGCDCGQGRCWNGTACVSGE
jgi:hypothetical protein